MLETAEGPSDWKKQQEAIQKRLKSVAKDSDSKIAKTISDRKEKRSDKSIQQNCELISMLCYEAQDQLREGKMSVKEVVKDLCEALESVASMKEEKEEKDEE